MHLTISALLAALAATTLATTTTTVGTETFVFKWGKLISGVPTALPTAHFSRPRVLSGARTFADVVTTTVPEVATKTVQARGIKQFWQSFTSEEADSFKHFGEKVEQEFHHEHHRRDVEGDGEADKEEDREFEF